MLNIPRIFFHKLYWRFTNIYAHFELRASGVVIGAGSLFFGLPVIKMAKGSKITIGEQAMLISTSHYTALGVNHPVVLRTLQSGASIVLGTRVGISGGSICAVQSVEIGADTLLGANVTIADTDFHSINPHYRRTTDYSRIGVAPVKIGSRVFIGTNAIVLKGVTIGDNTIIGAGSVVTKSIPANVIAAGNPCRVIRNLTEVESC